MPITKIQFQPGVNRENTNYSNKGGYYACDKVRFRSGYPEQIGGWINYSVGNTFVGITRSLFTWTTTDSESLLGFGTTQKYYVEYNGQYQDITPDRATSTTTQFATTLDSKLVAVTVPVHGAAVNTWITFTGSLTFNGVTISGSYEIVRVINGNTFNIAVSSAATSTGTSATALSVTFDINAGTSTYTTNTAGWGIGPWSNGGWGESSVDVSTTTGTQIQLWSQSNFGSDLIFAPRGNSIYWWTKDTTTFASGVTLNEYASTVPKATKIATFGSGVTTITVPDNIGINAGATVAGTGIPAGTYVTTSYTGGTSVPISAATTAPSSGTYTFSHSGYFVPNTTNQIIASDINQFAIAIGANPYDPTDFNSDFNPMLVRWSDQTNPVEWVPETTNQAGEQLLASGSFLVCARSTRQEILVWSDSALYTMQYIGSPYIFSFQLLMDNISIISPNAAVTVNNVTYWMGVDKFYIYSGQVQTLPCTLRNHVFRYLNSTQGALVVCGSNPGYNEVWWHYPSAGSLINDSYIIYNYVENIWYFGTMNRTAWLSSPLQPYPLAAYSVQNTYIRTAISSTATSITTVNAQSYPTSGTVTIDSEQITYTGNDGYTLTGCTRGANGTTAAAHAEYSSVTFYIPNQIVYHEYGIDDLLLGPSNPVAISSYIETSDFDITDGDHFAFVRRMLPDMSFDGSTAASPTVRMILNPRQNSGSAYTTPVPEPEVTGIVPPPAPPNVYPIEQYTGQIYTRVRGRQIAFRIESNDTGVTWQLGSMRFDVRPDGRRA